MLWLSKSLLIKRGPGDRNLWHSLDILGTKVALNSSFPILFGGWINCVVHLNCHAPAQYAWVGVGAFLRWWQPSTMWAGPLIFYGHHQGCLNNPIFSNLRFCAACWACFMCHHKLWPTSVSHPFSLNSSWGFAGGKQYQKITIPIFRLVLQNFAIPCCFPYVLFYRYIFSLLSSGWFVIAVCCSISVQWTSLVFRIIVNWCRVAISKDKST